MSDSPPPSISQTTSISAPNHRLPSIPSLPPIDIPRSNLHSSSDALDTKSSSLQPQESEDPSSAKLSVSIESYTTACSSPVVSANAADAATTDMQGTPTAPSPATRSLPKSLSVDSFVREQHQQRDAVPSAHFVFAESTRTVSQSKSHSRLQSFDPKLDRRQPDQPPTRRSTEQPPPLPPRNLSAPALRTLAQRVKRQSRQGSRVNLSEDDVESSPYEDSEEVEQGHSGGGKVMTKASQLRRRLTAPKRSGSMPVSRASSQLHLHGSRSRKAAVITIPTEITKINTTLTAQPTSTTIERSPQLRTKASAPTPLEATRRGRSFSIGTQSDDSSVKKGKPSLLLHIDTERPPQDAVLMTLVIIGSQGCGKSAFMRRAWKNSLLTEAARHSVSVSVGERSKIIHYITRKAYMQAHEGRDYYLTLIELPVQELEHADGNLHGDVWPTGLPKIDGAFVLYDASDESSFKHIEELLRGYYARGIPYIVLACKSDLPHQKEPSDALQVVKNYDGGIVEISGLDSGRDKARRCVGVLLRGVLRRRIGDVDPSVNPCSPIQHHGRGPSKRGRTSPLAATTSTQSTTTPTSATVTAPSQQSLDLPRQPPQMPLPPPLSSRSISSLAEQTAPPVTPPAIPTSVSPSVVNPPQSRPPYAPTSPTRARSMGDIGLVAAQPKQLSDQSKEGEQGLNRSRSILDMAQTNNKSADSVRSLHETGQHTDPEPVIPFKKDQKQGLASPWATLDELLEKLLFLCISGDDPFFISHFFLTYRRFTTPRRILLCMQKRMIELNQPSADPTLAAFAQMRICNLLEQWIQCYPTDFAVPGSAGALNALIRQILRQTHTIYYGTEFLPFLESLHTIQDLDNAWAVKAETTIDESDESDSNYESDYSFDPPLVSSQPAGLNEKSEETLRPSTRERKSSIPLSAKTFLQNSIRAPGGSTVVSPARDSLQRLQKVSNSLLHFDTDSIAMEITRRECELYMKIEPRDWLRHTMVSGKKDPNTDRIARFNASYNDLHDWAASMILCHDKPKTRARVVEKLAEVGVKLRNMNNYSGLRAIITAITQSTYPNDEVMDIFKQRIDLHKRYLSSDILMRTAGAHQSYRMALRNTKGPCIPSLEVHTSDLRRAHEGNPDYKSDDPTLIHWAKFDLIGKLVRTTTESQDECRGPTGYEFPVNPQIGQLFDVPLMDYDLQQERLGDPPDTGGDIYSTPIPPTLDHPAHPRDPSMIKRLFFWS